MRCNCIFDRHFEINGYSYGTLHFETVQSSKSVFFILIWKWCTGNGDGNFFNWCEYCVCLKKDIRGCWKNAVAKPNISTTRKIQSYKNGKNHTSLSIIWFRVKTNDLFATVSRSHHLWNFKIFYAIWFWHFLAITPAWLCWRFTDWMNSLVSLLQFFCLCLCERKKLFVELTQLLRLL